ncbi:hypothetical protein DE146DRAFT_665859 [Phaeosphaeria sp. MPI-PUGE-AT-0046c]|nr:hypothetical protein DE146DRAFT_665859 [Phaeosphaeria sp. MPI-PUGE-AT-0046c]
MATDENVEIVLGIVDGQLSRDEAVQLLKICDNNIEAAVNKFYETDPANLNRLLRDSVPRWDESAFGAGSYAADDHGSGHPTFSIDYAPGYENYPHSNVQSRAPTRPPSRTSQVSTHLGDAPMQSIETTQESGLIGNSNPVFGPATKEYYDTAQWAMVPTATEVIPDPIPSQRKREEGQPAILKPSPRFNYLPALLAILHSIPLYRNALLASQVSQRSYWMGDEWWKGNPALPARVIDTADREAVHGLDILHETQRLMAFLDKSDRAYATVSSMLELDAWKESRPKIEDDDDDLLKFLMLWSSALEAQVPGVQLNGLLRSVINIGDDEVENFVLDASVVREGSRSNLSLYDVLDDQLFSGTPGSAHVASISKVLILRLNSATTNAQGLGCRIPATLYADRYMNSNKAVIDSMFHEMKQHEEEIQKLNAMVQGLKYHIPKKDKAKPVETLKLLKTSMKAFEARDGDEDFYPKNAAVLSQLQTLYQSIETKLATLDEQTKQVRSTLNSISSRFKPTVDDGAEVLIDLTEPEYPEGQSPQDAMHHPYHLRGVATHLGVVYLLHPDARSASAGAQQWWRVQYDTETSSPSIRHDRLTQQEVLERAATESASALLIYAHADALSVEPELLSKPLEDFVKKDGWNFQEELQRDATGWEDMEYETSNDVAKGTWDDTPHQQQHQPPGYDSDWQSISASEYHNSHNRHDSNLSSATLTPNTEQDDMGTAVGVQEMVEVNGGMDALTGVSSRASSSTVQGDDRMDIDEAMHGAPNLMDAPVAETRDREGDEPRVQHIEIAEKKGG